MTPAEIAAIIQAANLGLTVAIDLFRIAQNNGAAVDIEGLLLEYNALQPAVQAYKPIAEDPHAQG